MYFFLIVNKFSRSMWVAILKNKSKIFEAFKKYKTLAETESKRGKLKGLRIDHGREFTSEEFST